MDLFNALVPVICLIAGLIGFLMFVHLISR